MKHVCLKGCLNLTSELYICKVAWYAHDNSRKKLVLRRLSGKKGLLDVQQHTLRQKRTSG